MKRSFSLLELILTIFIILLIASYFKFKIQDRSLENASYRLLLYIKEVRYKALIDNKYKQDDLLWHKKRWTLKFFRCKKSVGGIYYVIYSDTNNSGHPKLSESLLDPLNAKRIYSSNSCDYSKNTSKYVLLTKEFDINRVEVSCNNTSSIGQISFGNRGEVYSKLSSYDNESEKYQINEICNIRIYNNDKKYKELVIEPNTGYSYIK